MEDCIFCRIARGEIPCGKVYENDRVLAFDDIHPAAPVHVIIIPKQHMATLLDLKFGQQDLSEALFLAANEVARIKGVDEKGFRFVINCNSDGGQVVFHLHAHVLGGRRLADGMG